ncbi:hypothetical protein V8E53_004740, partial [Lactarius tabidus]
MPRHLLQAVKSPCPRGIELLNQLNTATMRIPANIPLATPAHRLSDFSADPHTCIASPEEDIEEGDWPILNTMLKTAFRWGELEMEENAKSMLNCSEHGLDGFIQFFKYFVLERSLKGVMIETKVEALLHQLDKQYAPCTNAQANAPTANGTAKSPIVLDGDTCSVLIKSSPMRIIEEKRDGAALLKIKLIGQRCGGIL